MTDIREVSAILGETFRSVSMAGRGRVWRAEFPEVSWLIELDKLPYGHRLALDLGLHLAAVDVGSSRPARATDCSVLMHLENLPMAPDLEKSTIIRAFDLDSDIDDNERRAVLEQIGRAVAAYVIGHSTLGSVREALVAGDLASAFIRRDARRVLEQE
jgi:hypothetical protein